MSSSLGSRRQLPPWMLRSEATDQLSNSVSQVKNKDKGLGELSTKACQPKSSVHLQQHAAQACQSETTKTDLCLLKKCKTTRSRRKPVKQAEDDVSNVNEGGDVEKENYPPPKRKRKAKVFKATKSNSEESTLSEDELSVDDLISIAKECINVDQRKERQISSLPEFESESWPRSISSEDKTSHKDNTPSSESLSNVNTLEASSSDLVECQPSEGGVISSFKTADLAQDMIELLLGPLFKRCSEVKPNPEPVTKSVTLDYLSTNQTQDGLIEDAVPVARKKGSLKDKVAMLLS